MAIKQKPRMFVAGDGVEFESKAEAERHDKFIEALRAFNSAKAQLATAAAYCCKTSDGKLFEFGGWHCYWFLVLWGMYGPCLREIKWPWPRDVELDEDNERASITVEENGKRHSYSINELYADEANAKVALANAIREHIAEKQAELTKLEAK